MISFDTETTGFDKPKLSPLCDQPYMMELGAVKLDNELNLTDRFSELYSIPIEVPSKIMDITGIVNEDLVGKRTLAEGYEDLYNFFEGEDEWIGHNVMFDYRILKYNLQRIGKEDNFPWPKRFICTVNESIFLKGYRLKLAGLYEMATGKKITGWHRALSDAESTAICYKWLRNKHGVV
jgi:DNA polymerase III epsilon subunit-like protein